MRTLAITALIGTIVAIPLLIARRKRALIPVENERLLQLDNNRRYDVDDFMM